MAVVETRFRAMASAVLVIVNDGPADALDVARCRIETLEARWSRFIPSSELTRLNLASGEPVAVQPETLLLIECMIQAHAVTGGRYDPTLLPTMLRIGYTASIDSAAGGTVTATAGPTASRSRSVHPPITAADVDHRSGTVTLPRGVWLDPGGIGKGLAADLVVAELLDLGAAGVLVSIGGDLAAAGTSPAPAGWEVEIEDPDDLSGHIGRFAISGGGVATSSTRSRRWVQAGMQRHHVIDPDTDEPSGTDLATATVMAPCGWLAEVHATGVLLEGTAGFTEYTNRHGLQAVAVTADRRLVATPGAAGILAGTAS